MHADEVGIFIVEFIHEDFICSGSMLRDFLDESLIVQAMNLLELRRLVGDLDGELCYWIAPSAFTIMTLVAWLAQTTVSRK